MSVRILKFTLLPGVTELRGIRCVLAVGWQGEDLRLWAETDEVGIDRTWFYATPTGHFPPPDAEFVGTAIGVPFVFHIYRQQAKP